MGERKLYIPLINSFVQLKMFVSLDMTIRNTTNQE